MRKLELLGLVGFFYVGSLWINQNDLHSSVPLLVVPLWIWLILRAAGYYAALLFLTYYSPRALDYLHQLVDRIVAEEDWDV
jgi:hypothetical protein